MRPLSFSLVLRPLALLTGAGIVVSAATIASAQPGARAAGSSSVVTQRAIARQPLTFFPADGGTGAYRSHLPGYDLEVRATGMTIRSQRVVERAAAARSKGDKLAADGGLRTAPAASTEIVEHQTAVEFLGASPLAKVEPLERTQARVNRFVGSDPARWQHDLPTYARVRAQSLYPGIDLTYYGAGEGRLEYDLVVAPHADLGRVRFRASGDTAPELQADGSLALDGKDGNVRLNRPVLYQDEEGSRHEIAGSFVQLAPGEFGFRAEGYDHSRPLVVDPTIKLVYATYAGGIHNELAYDLALDGSGNAYVVGQSASQDFLVTGNALQTARSNIGTYTYDAVILKFDPSGALIYSTFLGGSNNDQAYAVVANPDGSVFVGGQTNSSDFPVTAGAFQTRFGGGGNGDAFLAKLSNDGAQLLYSTYLGGPSDESIQSLQLNSDGSLLMAGSASGPGLPVSANAAQKTAPGADDDFVARAQFSQAGVMTLPNLTYIGGSGNGQELGYVALTTDATGNVYLGGGTTSSDYPATANAFEKPFKTSGGCYNTVLPNTVGTLTKLSPDLSQILYSTVIGGHIEDQNGYPVCNQFVRSVHVDTQGNIWLVGTVGMSDFPTTANAMSKQLNGNGSAGVDDFIAELSPDGTRLLYGSYFGGSQFDYGSRATWDAAGHLWLATTTQSPDFPVTADALQMTNAGGYDTGITEFSLDATTILYSTFLGGSGDEDINGSVQIKLDAQGNVRLAGITNSANYPVTGTAVQPLYANGDVGPDGYDIYYAVLGTGLIGTVSPASFGNGGDGSISVSGVGFQSGATCQITQGTTVLMASVTSVNPGGTQVNCALPLTGLAAGTYSVTVTNPNGGSSFTKPNALTITGGGGQPNISAQVIGRPAIRIGTPTTFYIAVTNSGTQDGYLVPLWVKLPSGVPFAINGYTATFSAGLATTVGNTNYVLLLLPGVATGNTITIPLQITAPLGSTAAIPIGASVQAPWFGTMADLEVAGTSPNYTPTCVQGATSAINNCLGAYASIFSAGGVATNAVPSIPGPPNLRPNGSGAQGACQKVNAWQQAYDKGKMDGRTDSKNGNSNNFNPPAINADGTSFFYRVGYATGIIEVIGEVAGGGAHAIVVPGAQLNPVVVANLLTDDTLNNVSVVRANALLPYAATSCPLNPPPPPPAPVVPTGGTSTTPVGAIDPNEKSGSQGDGSASHFLPAGAPLPYQVGFENKPTATAPASQVIVTDQLDASRVDLSTLALGNISFGKTVIPVPNGVNNFNTLYKAAANLNVRIQASLDIETGLLKWTFTSLDPRTGQPPTDPSIGFLPADIDGVVGQGNVLFTVLPLKGQSTGTAISNTATVVFDANAPIGTPTWLNTIDADPPASAVLALAAAVTVPAGTTTFNFPVAWSGTDKGSGIKSYSIFVSDNGAAFLPWLTAVTITTAPYTGTVGHTYGFYSVAMDAAGNTEGKTNADSTTLLTTLGSSVTTLSVSATSVPAGTPASFTATVAPASGTSTPTGSVTFMAGASTVLGAATLSAGKATLTSAALAVGGYTITAVYGGDSTFAASTSAATLVTITAPAPDFTLSLSSGNTTLKESGGSATTTVSATPGGGFSGSVALSCSGLPVHTTCLFSPAMLALSGNAAQTSTLTITTDVTSALVFPRDRQGVSLACFGGGLFALVMLRRKRTVLPAVLSLGMLAAGLGLSGCGSSGAPFAGTPAGTYAVIVTASSGATVHSATYTLNVQ